jgi:phosphatidylserine/phosphatidylglycerophosphate/cardiolipin synthase-like enzyme
MGKRPYPSYYTSVDGEAIGFVLGFIARTTKTLDCMVYSITHPDIVAALIEAHNRGVAVRVITDNLQAAGKYSLDEELVAAGIEVRVDNSGGSMHHKDAICDLNETGLYAVLTGSFNWTKGAATRNDETAVILRTKKECLKAQAEFDRLWAEHAPEA